MKIDYRQKGKVKFSMYEYIEKMLEELPTNMEGLATTQHLVTYLIQTQDVRSYAKNRGSCSTT